MYAVPPCESQPQQTSVGIRTARQGGSACGLQLLDGGLDALLEAQTVAQESLTSAGILTGARFALFRLL